jgi:hypothetical protein
VGEEALRPTEERSLQEYWDGDDRPDPLVAQNAPEFVAQLRALVQWSGLTLEEIEQLARANGDILPPSLLSAALSHRTLPPEEVVVALVAAIGDDDDMVELWASVLWRIEEGETAQFMAPLSAPPPPSPATGEEAVGAARQYSGGALAQAIHKRRDKDSWTGLHRGFKKGLRATGFGAKYGRWPLPAAIGATVLILIVGAAWAMTGGDDGEKTAVPPPSPCCITDPSASADPEALVLPSDLPSDLPFPTASTRPTSSPNPRQPLPPGMIPTPTETQTQLNPDLNSNGSKGACVDDGANWVITLSVTATLTGAPQGDSPQGLAGKQDDLRPFNVNGGGTTSFHGQMTITLGPNGETASGTVAWSLTVTVPGFGPVSDGGSEGYSCGIAA